MKVSIASEALLEALTVTASTAASRTPKPALQGVLIHALPETVLLMSTDLEMGVRCRLTQVEVLTQGEALVPAAKLSQIVRAAQGEAISMSLEGNVLHITFGESHFQVYSGDPREFPPVPEMEGQPDFQITGGDLRRLTERTLFSAARESTRYAIDGLLWEHENGRLKVVATDGRRLALASCALDPPPTGPGGRVIVPAKAMGLFSRVVSDPEERFGVKFHSNQILVRNERLTISSVLVEGHFPKYSDVIPQDCNKKITFKVGEMLGAVHRAGLLTSEDSKSIRLSFSRDQVVMTGRAPDQGESSVRLALSYSGEPLEIGFNPTYLIDILKVLDAEEACFQLKEANRPGLFRDGEEYVYVVMPVNLT